MYYKHNKHYLHLHYFIDNNAQIHYRSTIRMYIIRCTYRGFKNDSIFIVHVH